MAQNAKALEHDGPDPVRAAVATERNIQSRLNLQPPAGNLSVLRIASGRASGFSPVRTLVGRTKGAYRKLHGDGPVRGRKFPETPLERSRCGRRLRVRIHRH